MKASLFVAVSAVTLALAPTPALAIGTSPGAASAPDPILFVHGWNSSPSRFDTMANRFRADGWPDSHLDKWSYNHQQSNAMTAQQLAAEVERLRAATGADQVDVITHSMGGLSSRYYAKNLGGSEKIDAWVSLGGPNHGTDTANLCFDISCREMRPGSEFLTALNSGDETPGATRYATWWSPCDAVINPDSSVALSGAVNTKTACLSHSELAEDATVYGQARDMVAA